MPITFSCPCGRVLRAADEHAGCESKCPVCGRALTVPAEDAAAPLRPVRPEGATYGVLGVEKPFLPDSAAGAPTLRPRLNDYDEEDLRDRRPRRGPRDPDRRRSAPPFVVSKRVVTGVLMMAAGVVLFLFTASGRRLRIYPIFLFIGGLISLIKGLMGNED